MLLIKQQRFLLLRIRDPGSVLVTYENGSWLPIHDSLLQQHHSCYGSVIPPLSLDRDDLFYYPARRSVGQSPSQQLISSLQYMNPFPSKYNIVYENHLFKKSANVILVWYDILYNDVRGKIVKKCSYEQKHRQSCRFGNVASYLVFIFIVGLYHLLLQSVIKILHFQNYKFELRYFSVNIVGY